MGSEHGLEECRSDSVGSEHGLARQFPDHPRHSSEFPVSSDLPSARVMAAEWAPRVSH